MGTANEPSAPLKEIEAMKQVAGALSGLEEESIRRVLSWANDYFGISIGNEQDRRPLL